MTGRAGLPLALTQGDPAGIGPELILRAWLSRDQSALPVFFAIADPDHLRRLARELAWDVPISVVEPEEATLRFSKSLPVMPLATGVSSVPGKPSPADAAGTVESIRTAVTLTQSKRAAAIVTNPIAKHVLYAAGFPHPGHTEFLASLAASAGCEPPHPVMMLWSRHMAVVPVTVHIPLAEIPRALTTDLIVRTGRIVAGDLRERFGLPAPRLALAGLNPHAGENGSLGAEDDRIVAPAVAALRADGIAAEGPLPADTMFHPRARKRYDAALAMYHDQALIPIKTIAFDEAVNVTLGLPFIRTSPDHGTAFDIAGKGIARPDSLIEAIRLAARLGGRNAS